MQLGVHLGLPDGIEAVEPYRPPGILWVQKGKGASPGSFRENVAPCQAARVGVAFCLSVPLPAGWSPQCP